MRIPDLANVKHYHDPALANLVCDHLQVALRAPLCLVALCVSYHDYVILTLRSRGSTARAGKGIC